MGKLTKARAIFFEALNSIDEWTALVLKRTIIPALEGFSHERSFEKRPAMPSGPDFVCMVSSDIA